MSEDRKQTIWDDLGLIPMHYRILWWMIDMGAMRGPIVRGWMDVCAKDLGIHRITLNRRLRKLAEKGFVVKGKKGTYGLVPEAFRSDADVTRVKILAEAA